MVTKKIRKKTHIQRKVQLKKYFYFNNFKIILESKTLKRGREGGFGEEREGVQRESTCGHIRK